MTATTSAARTQAMAYPQLDPSTVLIRPQEVLKMTGLSLSTLHRLRKEDPSFPKAVSLCDFDKLGAPIGFVLSEVQDWVRNRVAQARAQ